MTRYPPLEGFSRGMTRKARSLRELLSDPVAPLAVYAGVLGLLAMLAVVTLPLAGFTLGAPWLVLVLAVSAAAAERGTVRLSSSVEVSVGLLPTLLAAVVLGPLAALAVSAASMLGDLGRAKDVPLRHLRWIVYTCSRSLTGAVTGVVVVHTNGFVQSQLGAIFIATTFGALTSEVLDLFFVSLTVRLRGNRMIDAARDLAPVIFSSVPLFVP